MRIRAGEIADRLAGTAEQVAAMLLPAGKRQGGYWIAGDVSGAEGKSLKVYLTGPKAGRWNDYATGEHGDLLDLWAAQNTGGDLAEAMRDAAEWLGIRLDPVREPRVAHQRPEKRFEGLNPEHAKWLAARGLSEATIEAYGVGSAGSRMAFPSYLDGELARVKYRTPDKQFSQEKDCVHCLFGWQAVPPNARSIAIVEGELDAMAFHEYGMPALSVPDGGGRKQGHWIEIEYDRLNRFDTIFLALDGDEAGEVATQEILERFGTERCRVVALPHKDANECLMQGVTKEQLRECFRGAAYIDPEELKRPSEFFSELCDEFYGTPDSEVGFGPPFPSIESELRFRPGELVLLAGHNGTGKSQFCGHLMLEAMRSGYRACIASMELKPARYLKRLAKQTGATEKPTEPFLKAIDNWWNDKLWIFNLVGTAKRERMLEVFKYARHRYNVRVFLIDNLAKCGIAEDDYNGQKEFVDQLTDFAKLADSTVILVHHMRKSGDGKLAVKGTGAITDMADTVLLIWRNKEREEALKEDPQDPEWIEKPSGVIRCEKQRNGDSEPNKAFWFDHSCYQFLSSRKAQPFRYVGWSSYQDKEAAA